MSFRNPNVPWSELERRLSGRQRPNARRRGGAAGARRRATAATARPGRASAALRAARRSSPAADAGSVPYAELHCHSNFCFLDGASHPEELAEEAARLGLEALALTDHDGFYGVVRFAEAARAVGLPHGVRRRADRSAGARGDRRQTGPAARPATGRRHLRRARRATPRATPAWPGPSAAAQLRGREGRAPLRRSTSWPTAGAGAATGWCSPGAARVRCRPRWSTDGPAAAGARAATGWSSVFGRDHVVVELWDHGDPLDSARNDALAELAVRPRRRRASPPTTCTTPPRPPRRWPPRWPRCGPGAASTSSTAGCPAAAGAHLRSGAEQARRFAPLPGRGRARPPSSGAACAFDLRAGGAGPAAVPVPAGPRRDDAGCAELDRARAPTRYGHGRRTAAERVPGAWAQIDHELDVIEQLGFPGYFLDRVGHRRVLPPRRHLLPGPGLGRQLGGLLRARHHQRRRRVARAAVRAVPVARARRPARHRHRHRVRPPRGGHPVRLRALRPRTTPRRSPTSSPTGPRSAVRDMAKALGYAPGQQDAWSQADRRAGRRVGRARERQTDHDIPRRCSSWRRRSRTSPATSASTPAAWCICDRPVIEVCPVEWARMDEPHACCSGTRTTAPRSGW